MKFGIVIGNVWTSNAAPETAACPMQIIQPLTSAGRKAGGVLVAADPKNIGAPGAMVVYVTSTDAAAAFASGRAPVNASIVGLVDELS
ncbi:MAG: EutN/CcmL family microcompartment protein [Acidobacteriota bacterium]